MNDRKKAVLFFKTTLLPLSFTAPYQIGTEQQDQQVGAMSPLSPQMRTGTKAGFYATVFLFIFTVKQKARGPIQTFRPKESSNTLTRARVMVDRHKRT